MSSDSEDDCYGNIAQKLHSIRSKYTEDKIKTSTLLGELTSVSFRNDEKPIEFDKDDLPNDSNTTINSLDGEENILDIIIASNAKKRGKKSKSTTNANSDENILDIIIASNSKKRGKKSKSITSDISTDNILPERASRQKRAKTGAKSPRSTQFSEQSSQTTTINSNVTSQTPNQSVNEPSVLDTSSNISGNTSRGSRRGRTAARARGRGSNTSRTTSNTSRRNRQAWGWFPNNSSNLNSIFPIYSVGNTDEYPDECDNQELFSKTTIKPSSNDVQVIEDTEIDNEELSVKVYWQNSEYVKFNIRKYQKLTPIFELFSQREKVTQDKLFFTYNDKILKSTDTPDSINYSIAKFIDGGIVKQNVSKLLKETDNVTDGIVIKFQCQTKKTPFVTKVKKDEPLLVAMTKCAENLEQPVQKLKFYFDGDLITGKSTAADLELEGGECIDVKIIS